MEMYQNSVVPTMDPKVAYAMEIAHYGLSNDSRS